MFYDFLFRSIAPIKFSFSNISLSIQSSWVKRNCCSLLESQIPLSFPALLRLSSTILFRITWLKGSASAFKDLVGVEEKRMHVDYRHSRTGVTLLMAASFQDDVEVVNSRRTSEDRR